MTSPAPQPVYYVQCVYAKFDPYARVKRADGTLEPQRYRLIVSKSYGVVPVTFDDRPPEIPRPNPRQYKEPQLPSTCTLASDERVIQFSQRDNEREMSGSEVAAASAWLVWRWSNRDTVDTAAPAPRAGPGSR